MVDPIDSVTVTAPVEQHARPRLTYSVAMSIIGVFYLLAAALFLFFPEQLIVVLNALPRLLSFAEPLGLAPERFWTTLAAGGSLPFALLSFMSAYSPEVRGYALVHVASKTLIGAGFFYLFFRERPYFAYLVAGSIDGMLSVFVLWKALSPRKNKGNESP